jgi:2-polyprenyl-3-methyl-5-hydroxy-6-metoxy-1,4-benzoquinol methylase
LNELSDYYDQRIDEDLNVSDYHLLQCRQCGLEYGSPMQPGSDLYYQWITGKPGYYPSDRWEWGAAIDRIKTSQSGTNIDILEIGCGSGRFLELARSVNSGRVVGLDTTTTSVDYCQNKGLEVYCESVESFLHRTSSQPSGFDFVVAFHCLEHVSNPKEFVASMAILLKPSGRLYLSTPYSPMSFEGIWFDPQNNPPHHLTRWNCRAYKELARQLNLKISFFMPPASSTLNRTLYALNLAWHGPSALVSRKKMFLSALAHPFDTLGEYIRQMNREKVDGETAADVVLVELTRRE